MSPTLEVLGSSGTQELVNNIKTKLDASKLVSLTLEEYNELFDKGLIDLEAYYFIIDDDNDIFTKVIEMEQTIEELQSSLKEVQDFKNQFPFDNRTYGIINQQPKNLSEVFPDELGIPTDKNDPETPEEPNLE